MEIPSKTFLQSTVFQEFLHFCFQLQPFFGPFLPQKLDIFVMKTCHLAAAPLILSLGSAVRVNPRWQRRHQSPLRRDKTSFTTLKVHSEHGGRSVCVCV